MNCENQNIRTGILTKVTGGFYYVDCQDEVFECKAKGAFRKSGSAPVAGDRVEVELKKDGYHSLSKILPRKNYLTRPPLANLDRLFIVVSSVRPEPNTLVIDKLTAAASAIEVEPVIVFSKTDISAPADLCETYRKAGFRCIVYSDVTKEGVDEVKSLLEGRLSAFIGNSGVGKSTLLNNILPDLGLKTADISDKLGRGKHTTRTVELYKLESGFIADTPGFSTVDLIRYSLNNKDELMYCFPEFEDYIPRCMFTSCSHTVEKGCAVIEAVKSGKISHSRHASYKLMYEELKDIKAWELK
ncbi:MAG: ribosome small subunit-dependent GTPase A [Ruminococcus sp.]|nr:ribosome small subunit-dependent GTPase A [Ruminococcus sp.]